MIYEIIDSIIESFGYPFYVGMPNFGDDEPELYIVYTLWEVPDFYGDGEYLATKYTISLHFFCDIMHFSECRRVEKQIKKRNYLRMILVILVRKLRPTEQMNHNKDISFMNLLRF